MKTLLAAGLLAALAAALPGGAARAETKLGVLSCSSDGATGFIIGSSENVACAFKPANAAGRTEGYAGTLDTFGLDVGVTGETQMAWVVLSAGAGAYAPGSLAGSYVGASADASVAAGGGVKVLVGGAGGAITLQPLSIQTQEGINAAVGVTKFTLAATR